MEITDVPLCIDTADPEALAAALTLYDGKALVNSVNNAAFIAMAIRAGLTCPITNPLVPEVNAAVLAADLAMGRDDYGTPWIQAYRQREKAKQG